MVLKTETRGNIDSLLFSCFAQVCNQECFPDTKVELLEKIIFFSAVSNEDANN